MDFVIHNCRGQFPSSKDYLNYADSTKADLIDELKAESQGNGAIANGHAEHEVGAEKAFRIVHLSYSCT